MFDTITRDDVRARIGDTPSQAVADQVHQVWVDFINNADPGWAAQDTTSRTTGLLTDDINAVDDPSADERTLWNGIRQRRQLSAWLGRAGQWSSELAALKDCGLSLIRQPEYRLDALPGLAWSIRDAQQQAPSRTGTWPASVDVPDV